MKIFSKRLIEWYNLNHRDLPWRNTMNPYFIWVSEIILQQTRISQGLNYYLNFIKHFPNIESLARAKEDDIMKIWQGLGYYTRARNMHITSKEIAYTHEGHFPTDYKELKKLKGIGDYTAAAIASFAYNEKVPVVDGNVYR
ncbi:MAG: A/G-specific adenine glycosylase, partial [Bacteroidota bacterium]